MSKYALPMPSSVLQENRHQKETASHLQQEADRLRADNVKLYEKIKFLQSYPSSSQQLASLEDETTGRYSSQYEARLDPFSAFSQKVGGAEEDMGGGGVVECAFTVLRWPGMLTAVAGVPV